MRKIHLFLALLLFPFALQASIPDLKSIIGQQEEFLHPDVAFVFSADVEDGHVRAHWVIADGYYLYKKQFQFTTDTPGATLGAPVFPQGEQYTDEFFGTQEVFRQEVEIRVPIVAGSGAFALRARYQGCADAGLCYPPIVKISALETAGFAGAAPTGTASAAGELPEQDRLAELIRTGSLLAVMLAFIIAGLLLAFTPCVLPMVPILSSIIIGQGKDITTRKAFTLSLIYVLAMAVTYTLAGVFVALLGQNLQVAFQNPWVIGVFSAVFVLLSLSMFGLYELQMPASVQARLAQISNSQKGGTYSGVAIMGFLSALIVGPCITAPLVAALIVIGQSGDPLRGGLALFALSIGMGLPLLAIGTSAGKLVPRAGAWMDVVKAAFGFLLLGVAAWLLERMIPAGWNMLNWGLLALGAGVYFASLQLQSGWRVVWRTAGIALAAWGLAIVVGLAAGNRDPIQPLYGIGGGAQPAQAEHLAFKRIKSVADLEREVAQAAAQNRPVMLDFYADWCISCKEMEKYTFNDPAVQNALRNALLLQADVTANDATDQALLNYFGIFGPPSIVFFDSAGNELRNFRVVGYLPAQEFRAHIERAFGNQ